MIAAKNGWAISFDNMSFLPDWLSDAACRLSTGGGISKRELFSDDEEVILNVQRPLILNGIDEFVVRGDLLDRSIVLHLPSIAESGRKAEDSFWKEYEAARPAVLGALLSGVSTALRELPHVKLDELPRMADFALWVTAAESAFGWDPGSFLKVYKTNQIQANDTILESSALTPFLHSLSEPGWEGTASALLTTLNEMRGRDQDGSYDKRGWPSHPKALSDKLRRLAPVFRRIGVEIRFYRTAGNDSRRMISVGKAGNSCVATVAPSPSGPFSDEGNGCDAEILALIPPNPKQRSL